MLNPGPLKLEISIDPECSYPPTELGNRFNLTLCVWVSVTVPFSMQAARHPSCSRYSLNVPTSTPPLLNVSFIKLPKRDSIWGKRETDVSNCTHLPAVSAPGWKSNFFNFLLVANIADSTESSFGGLCKSVLHIGILIAYTPPANQLN